MELIAFHKRELQARRTSVILSNNAGINISLKQESRTTGSTVQAQFDSGFIFFKVSITRRMMRGRLPGLRSTLRHPAPGHGSIISKYPAEPCEKPGQPPVGDFVFRRNHLTVPDAPTYLGFRYFFTTW